MLPTIQSLHKNIQYHLSIANKIGKIIQVTEYTILACTQNTDVSQWPLFNNKVHRVMLYSGSLQLISGQSQASSCWPI